MTITFTEANCKIKNKSKKKEHLTQFHDTLLPKLMSGEIDVDNLEM